MAGRTLAGRTLAVMDNPAFLRRRNEERIDLIAIDAPFAANERHGLLRGVANGLLGASPFAVN